LLSLTLAPARGDDAGPPLSRQLTDLGRQALAQGHPAEARAFFQKALDLDPQNADARRALDQPAVRRVALQDPAPPPAPAPAAPAPPAEPPPAAPRPAAPPPAAPAPAATPAEARANLEEAARLEHVHRQQLTDDVRQRLQQARDQLNAGNPEAALATLRLAQNVVRAADQVDQPTRTALDRQIQAQYLATARAEERVVAEQAERLRLAAGAEQRARTLDLLARNQQTVAAMMTQFDSLMAQGQYNVLYN